MTLYTLLAAFDGRWVVHHGNTVVAIKRPILIKSYLRALSMARKIFKYVLILFGLYLIYASYQAYQILDEAELFKTPVFETEPPTLPAPIQCVTDTKRDSSIFKKPMASVTRKLLLPRISYSKIMRLHKAGRFSSPKMVLSITLSN